ncbi:TetR/AcrR family transcriptional regulator [Methyloparacoccus murrellii]
MTPPVSDRQIVRRPGRPRKAEEALRRRELLEQALSLFSQHGYGHLSLEHIAREARVSLRTIYRYFGGKAGLFRAVIRGYSDLFVAALPVGEGCPGNPEPVLLEFAREYLYHVTRPELIQLRIQAMALARQLPEVARESYAEGPERTITHLARFFECYRRNGLLAPVDTRFLAGQFVNALRGERYQRLQFGLEPTPSRREIDDWAREAVSLFLRGCLDDRGSG